MKKVLVTLLVAGSMIAGTTAGFAATTAKPTAPKASSKEGTATHEMSENSTTQKKEAKPATKASVKPMATTKAKTK